ncbi:MAG: TlpA disulfide reductase family protein [Bacteroidota bacterium]
MNLFEKYFKVHQAEFDQQSVRPSSWEAIESQLDADRRPARRIVLFRLAAGLALVLAGFLLFQPATDPLTAECGDQCPDIKMQTPEGQFASLSSLESKVTLINFWASWDEVCKENNCYVFLPIYEKYKDLGFEIYGIGLDEDKATWIESIQEDELPWIQVSDLKGWDSPIVQQLDVNQLPTYFLVDQDLNIIGRDLDPMELDQTLSTLLAYND